MFAGELIFIHPNLESHAVPFWLAMVLWLAFGVGAAWLGDQAYNRWQVSSNTALSRLMKLITVEAAIVVAAVVFFWVVFLLAGVV
ncbi:hypothetical protein [Luteibacter yeojuensis]|nr:hypothetical protein [Luteibacter yeojuensis]